MDIVTGSTGHLGNVLVRELLSQGKKVRAIIPGWEKTDSIDDIIDKIDVVEGDILDVDSLKRNIRKKDTVYHLAGIVDIESDREINKLYEVNDRGTRNVVQACLDNKVKRLLYVSSSEARTPPEEGQDMDEESDFDPEKVEYHYQKSKALATLRVKEGIKDGLDAVVVTPSGVIGPYDYKPSILGKKILKTLISRIQTSVEGSYDFVDVRDVAKCIILACEKGKSGENYIISNRRIKVSDLIKMVREESGGKPHILEFPYKFAKFFCQFKLFRKINPELTPQSLDIMQTKYRISHEKAEENLGYKHRPINDTIRDTVAWFRKTHNPKSMYERVRDKLYLVKTFFKKPVKVKI